MAKQKKKVMSRKKKRKPTKMSPLLSFMKRVVVGVSIVVAVAIAVLFVYSRFVPAGKKAVPEKIVEAPRPAPRKVEKKPAAPAKPARPASTSFKLPAQAEIPRLTVRKTEQVIRHEGYTVSYNSDYRVANWVAYELTSREAKSKEYERSNKFVPDPMVTGATATNEDYTRTGYDRGHMAPAGDMKWSAKAMRESFYFSNICPQKPGLNRGIWKELEEQCRLWAMDNGAVLVVTGPVLSDDLKRMGKNRVAIPKQFYKVICTVAKGRPEGIAFLFANKDYKGVSLQTMALPVDSVEKVTGIDFFAALPDEAEERMESAINWKAWSF